MAQRGQNGPITDQETRFYPIRKSIQKPFFPIIASLTALVLLDNSVALGVGAWFELDDGRIWKNDDFNFFPSVG